MKIEQGKAYRCLVGLQGIPTTDGEIVTIEKLISTPFGMEIKLNGERKTNVVLGLFRKPFFELI